MYLKFSNMGLSNDEIMSYIHNKSRDNARTPMQWNSNSFAGFSCVDPWIELNPNYPEINVENDMNSDFSIHDYYKKLIKYRKGNEIVRDGDFKEIGIEDSDIFSYTRTYKGKTLLVLGSFSDKKVCYNMPNNLQNFKRELVISNYDGNIEQNKDASTLYLRPYEALVFYMYQD